jgi:hypothetical protein
MHEYTSFNSGTMAWTRRTSDFVDAVNAEITGWNLNKRDPIAISQIFRNEFLPEKVAYRLKFISGSN